MHWRLASFSVVLVAQGLVLAFGALLIWLYTTWFLDDFVAASLTPQGWYQIALIRCLFGLVAAVLASGLSWYVTSRASRALGVGAPRTPLVTALACALVLSAVSVAGAVRFAVLQPFM